MSAILLPDLLEPFRSELNAAREIIIAYSGGLDSTVLLHWMVETIRNSDKGLPQVSAVHVNHGLHGEADTWASHCAEVCASLGVGLVIRRVDARADRGESPEDAARRARYRALIELVPENQILMTAHHLDDQAETFLLQLMRGAGIAGLGAMPESTPFGGGCLLRPLLSTSRDTLEAYATAHGLRWIDDPSNSVTHFDRNFIRREVLPLLRQRWPRSTAVIARSAGHCAESLSIVRRHAARLLEGLDQTGGTLPVDGLQQLNAIDQRAVLREWLRCRGYRAPSAKVLQRVLTEVLPAAPDRLPLVRWNEGEIRRYRDRLYLMHPLPSFDVSTRLRWMTPDSTLKLPGDNGLLTVEPRVGAGIRRSDFDGRHVSVRFRQGGESARLPGRQGRHSLKHLLQSAHIPPWHRDRLPLIYIDEELAAVPGLWVFEPFAATANEEGVVIHHEHPTQPSPHLTPP